MNAEALRFFKTHTCSGPARAENLCVVERWASLVVKEPDEWRHTSGDTPGARDLAQCSNRALSSLGAADLRLFADRRRDGRRVRTVLADARTVAPTTKQGALHGATRAASRVRMRVNRCHPTPLSRSTLALL
jgi:hypothetical protein